MEEAPNKRPRVEGSDTTTVSSTDQFSQYNNFLDPTPNSGGSGGTGGSGLNALMGLQALCSNMPGNSSTTFNLKHKVLESVGEEPGNLPEPLFGGAVEDPQVKFERAMPERVEKPPAKAPRKRSRKKADPEEMPMPGYGGSPMPGYAPLNANVAPGGSGSPQAPGYPGRTSDMNNGSRGQKGQMGAPYPYPTGATPGGENATQSRAPPGYPDGNGNGVSDGNNKGGSMAGYQAAMAAQWQQWQQQMAAAASMGGYPPMTPQQQQMLFHSYMQSMQQGMHPGMMTSASQSRYDTASPGSKSDSSHSASPHGSTGTPSQSSSHSPALHNMPPGVDYSRSKPEHLNRPDSNGNAPQGEVRGTPPDQAISSYSNGTSLAAKFLTLERELAHALSTLNFSDPVTHIYNPLDYAWQPHRMFVEKYLRGPVDVLFLGMNPGPYGMAQTGVPFGEVQMVQEWLGIHADVGKPNHEHPKRPIDGFDCKKNEVSGSRFWGFFQKLCGRPENFFRHCFVHNICPLIFMNNQGKNLTPPDLPAGERNPLNNICHRNLVALTRLLGVKIIVGIGKFAMERAKAALDESGIHNVQVEWIMHPSPANPAANKGWEPVVSQQLEELGLLKYFVNGQQA